MQLMQLVALMQLAAKQVRMEAHYSLQHQVFAAAAAAVESVYYMGQIPADHS